MTAHVLLIAEREIRTYVATASFWLALAIGPLVAGGALLFFGDQAPMPTISIESGDARLAQPARAALAEAMRFEGRQFRLGRNGLALEIAKDSQRPVKVNFARGFPLSPEGRAFVEASIERDAALAAAGQSIFTTRANPAGAQEFDTTALSGFLLMMMLWLTLTGSLGMLLQSIVRERANRALESLLAAVTPRDIMLGKLAGVGAISFGVLAAWLGSIVLITNLVDAGHSPVSAVFAAIVAPSTLLRAALIYFAGYALYGSLTIALGAIARDVAAAQNLSRPMFVVLLAAFFVSLSSAAAGSPQLLSWLVFVPPFAPFLLLLRAPTTIPLTTLAVSLGLVFLSALVIAQLAVERISIATPKSLIPRPLRRAFRA